MSCPWNGNQTRLLIAMTKPNARFDGSIPATYDRYLGPLLFRPYAVDLAGRVRILAPRRVLEVACGTGILTSELAKVLPPGTQIVATDLNDPMLAYAAERVPEAPIAWRQADACALPFPGGAFDAVVCQFGVMFVPDKPLAFREARRVLTAGGHYFFSVWDTLDHNPLGRIAHDTIRSFFPDNPPDFYQLPFGFCDRSLITRLLADAGFVGSSLFTVSLEGMSPSPLEVATGLVKGNPVLTAIQERGTSSPDRIVTALAAALELVAGPGPLRIPMQAIVVSARAG